VRRLLENGANSSFVNRIADPNVSIDELVADPVDIVSAMAVIGQKHDKIALPADLYDLRRNSAGLDLSNELVLAGLTRALKASAAKAWEAVPSQTASAAGTPRDVLNPADNRDVVGTVRETTDKEAAAAAVAALEVFPRWASVSPGERASMLDRAADIMQARIETLLGLIIREAGKSVQNAIAEVREAIDFLRYYAEQARRTLGPSHQPLGPVVCISPWNFPLAIFTGQIAAALVAGNPVLAKPAEETPLIAAEAVRILHDAGIPLDVVQLVPGDGRVGAALVAAPETAAVMFTGSTDVARLIQMELANRLSASGKPVPFIAETGGQNAMIVDSSALAEQVVSDVIASAFDSAGQRCSALRILCLQEDVADRTLAMLKGALRELTIANTNRLSSDIGPVITAEAKGIIETHVQAMRDLGCKVERVDLPEATQHGTFVSPTIVELRSISELKREVFGPVLHVVRWRRQDLDRLIDDINATGYGLTFGLHTRLDETIAHVTSRIKVGNLYVNRNVIGAVVGVQPFGGRGLSGTGPKAGGPLYLGRLLKTQPIPPQHSSVYSDPVLSDFARWLDSQGHPDEADMARNLGGQSALGLETELPGPVGERNIYALHARGRIYCAPITGVGLRRQVSSVLATGNNAVIDCDDSLRSSLDGIPGSVAQRISFGPGDSLSMSGALLEGDRERVSMMLQKVAAMPGPLLLTQSASTRELETDPEAYCLNWLLEEVSTSINTAAAGGNASLMSIG
jgi:RHH-type proline utilization regulon transcriptional repressor/proline dehydrogenase/delta 1-pyrroline-5-carboxylate dehydrogenase